MAGRKLRVEGSLAQLWRLIEPRQRRALLLLLVLAIIGALAEVTTIGVVVPFLALLAADPSQGYASLIEPFFNALGTANARQQLVAATSLLCLAAFVSGVLRILLARRASDFAAAFGHRLSVGLQRRMLMQPYSWHVRHHSSEQLATIEKAQLVTLAVVLPLVQTVAASILGLFVLAALVWIAPFLTVAALVTLGGIYFAIGVFARKRLDFHSSRIDDALDRRIRIVQEGLGGIREVILDGAQDEVVDRFRAPDAQLARSRADAAFVTSVPRYLIESLGITIIAVLAYSLSQREGGLIAALPVLGALALGAQRLLPVMQQLYTGWTSFAANSAIVDDVVRRLSLPVPPAAPNIVPLRFEHGVEFRGVSFSYEDRTHHAVKDLNFVVPHGSRVALLGPTGSGKTTTADLLMGLLEPTAGSILVDDVPLTDANRQSWRANVAHVPQMLFLSDTTIARNIAINAEPDMDRVREAAAMAQLDDFVASLPRGFETRVGERGVQISGGQRQRLAIARAIYKATPVLVFDEATSALDSATEEAVLSAIDGLKRIGRTIIIIAHRASTTVRCDQVLRLDNGRLVEDSSTRG